MERSFDAASRSDAEREKGMVISENLRMMNADMLRELRDESVGGNAGWTSIDGKRYSCAGANALVERMSGRLVAFGNMLSPKPGQSPITLLVAADVRREQPFFRIIRVSYKNRSIAARQGSHADDLFDTHAIDVLQRSIDEWNALQEVDITET